MSIPIKKEARVTQSKRYPRPDMNNNNEFGMIYPIGWR